MLRARIDMAHPNVLMRDPLLYRIRHASHHRTGDAWCIYPMYDWAHPLEDAIEGVTHSICTLEFESNRELYDWVLDHTGPWDPRPRQYEFARLALGYTVMSKRKLLQIVNEKRVSGWDDPRMPTIAGMRRRGVTPEALRDFADLIGVAKNNSVVDIGKFEFAIRGDLERALAPRAGRPRPGPAHPHELGAGRTRSSTCPGGRPSPGGAGTRKVPFGRDLLDRAGRLLRRPATRLEAARAGAGGPAGRRLRGPLRRGGPRPGRRGGGDPLHLRPGLPGRRRQPAAGWGRSTGSTPPRRCPPRSGSTTGSSRWSSPTPPGTSSTC